MPWWYDKIEEVKVEANLRKHYVLSNNKKSLEAKSQRLMAVGQIVGFTKDGKKVLGSGTMYGSENITEGQDPRTIKKYVITSV